MYKTRLEWALADKECVEHLPGTAPKLLPPPPLPGGTAQMISQAQHEALATWTKKEFLARNILGQKIPDSTLQKILHKTTVADMWQSIVQENKNKTKLVQSELRDRLAALRYSEKSDMRTHIDRICDMWEQLSAAGIQLSDKEKLSNIIRSLPPMYLSSSPNYPPLPI
ncbi:hypothetical protein SERLA73DRAFT_70844 [Serpula lacrymans var. lacrymans S7.3]|uniref:Uncharacterized protein n=1 Tax=Serpula lacrymans var. lacrymans (strain S7.3) TaxID=936435 RepID=F8PR19_SERL3|nr:hypothetical protein SERLA73DRAFT_70844 [Serpula lacrymans var. lacrymans S7.3]